MYFENFSSLLHMDGHGLYVWSAYAVGLLLIAYNVIAPLMARTRVVEHAKRQMRQKAARYQTSYKISHQHLQQGKVQ